MMVTADGRALGRRGAAAPPRERATTREVHMKAPIGSALVVLLGVAASAAWIRAVPAVEAEVINDPAPKGACGAAIARMETALNQARASGRVVASAPESVGAMLHRQPTRDSVARAQTESEQRVEASLATARKLRVEGKRSECIAVLEKVASPAGLR